MEFRGFFKNTSMKRLDQMKVEVSRQNKIKRGNSRQEIQQAFRHMSDSEEENVNPSQHASSQPTVAMNNKTFSSKEMYLIRLNRLQKFREERHRLRKQKKMKQKSQFVTFVCTNVIQESEEALPTVESVGKKITPLRERENPSKRKPAGNAKTPASIMKKDVKPRVDCWRTGDLVCKAYTEQPKKPLSEKKNIPLKPLVRVAQQKAAVRVKTYQQCGSSKSKSKNLQPTVTNREQAARPLTKLTNKITFKLNPPNDAGSGSSTAIFTSTVRKQRKPLTFSFEPTSENKPQRTLTVNNADGLFDGISPIEVEASPMKGEMAAAGVYEPSNVVSGNAGPLAADAQDSIWEPQPVATLSAYDATALDLDATEPANVVEKAKEMDTNCFIDDWIPAVPHDGSSASCVVLDDTTEDGNDVPKDQDLPGEGTLPSTNEHVVEDEPITKPALNESFTIGDEVIPADIGIEVEDVFGSRPIVRDAPTESPIVQGDNVFLVSSSPREETHETADTGSIACSASNEPVEDAMKATAGRKRSSLVFEEEPITSAISPSMSNMPYMEKKIRESQNGSDSSARRKSRRRRSSNVAGNSSQFFEQSTQPGLPKEVEEKTQFYYRKVDNELSRLQALCGQYAPYLEGDLELSDHCRGLIIAAQGQTNILINKKLTKFSELIGHYEKKWNDRKVRHDDLDGFWLMLSLDLENLDKRFEELRVLKDNNWQEVVEPEQHQPKVKKLQGNHGVRKREKKAATAGGGKCSSSVIANLIRKAREEKQKQKMTTEDLEVLKETVTVVATPVKRSAVGFGKTTRRNSSSKRSSVACTGFTSTVTNWEDDSTLVLSPKRRTIFPTLTKLHHEEVKPILKKPVAANGQRAKSVLFLDSGIETPQSRRRHNTRSFVDTPKTKIKFNDELEIEHIDNLIARTPSRLDFEIQKRRERAQVLGSSSISFSEQDNEDDVKREARKIYPRGTPRRSSSAVKRGTRRSSRALSDLFDSDCYDGNDSARRFTRSATRGKPLDSS